MKQARGIITDHGGRTPDAAIVSRELGIPAIVGTVHATHTLRTGDQITLSCAGGLEGAIMMRFFPFHMRSISDLPEPPTPLLMNISSPEEALKWWHIPCQGIGLAKTDRIYH